MNTQASNPTPAATQPQPSKSHFTRVVVIVLILLLTVAAFGIAIPWARYRYNNVVLREAAVRGAITKIGARIDGRIKSVDVILGQRVNRGQVLLQMEDTHFQAALDHARGELASAARELESEKLAIEQTRKRLTFEIGRYKSGIRKAQGELNAQKSSLARLEKQYDRVSSLVKDGAAARADMDKITGDRDRALALVSADTAVVEAAESNYERAISDLDGLSVRENRVGVLDAQIVIARAKVATAEADVEATIVRAPEDGRVIETIVNAGGSAKVGEPMLSLWIGKPWVEAWADERHVHKIQLNSTVDISFDSAPDRKLTGRVESIGLVTDKHLQPSPFPSTLHAFVRPSAMIPIRIALEDENAPLQLGLSVLVGIRKGSEPSAAAAQLHNSNMPKASSTITNNGISKL
ncbi:MAG TPA: HlyD family efflux transporter periplasmic adaptor subunit [Candidatus Acidoferrum sp.]|nr:HlyD family efflux transporter periplasmic adaptor subunit [Candidatus Acidoferrum sp.]